MQDHAIVIADATGTIHSWSPGAEQLFGWSAAEAVGRSLDLIVPEPQRARHRERFHEAMRTGESRISGSATELPAKTRHGGVVKLPARFLFLKDGRDRPVGAMAIFSQGDAG
jgi:PAS domain S-box-containing protein